MSLSVCVSIDSEGCVEPGWIEVYFLDLFDNGELWTSSEIMLEGFDVFRRAFNVRLDRAISLVLDVTDYLMPRGSPLAKKPVTNSLNVAAYYKSSCYCHLQKLMRVTDFRIVVRKFVVEIHSNGTLYKSSIADLCVLCVSVTSAL